MYAVADPGGGSEPGPPAPVKTSQKKVAAAAGRKFRESSGPLGQISGSTTGMMYQCLMKLTFPMYSAEAFIIQF